MENLVQWGLGVVQWIQTFRNPLFDQFFLTINVLGDQDFYILFLPVLFWCLHKALGMRLCFLFLFSMYVNQFLKDIFAAPRPYQVDSNLYAPIKQPGYGIPSGHAQGTTTVWGYIGTYLKKPIWWALAIGIPLFVSLGRMYLGDHFPQDVLLGLALGILMVLVFNLVEPRATPWLKKQSVGIQLALAMLVPLTLAVLHLTKDTAVIAGTLLGFYAGLVFEQRHIRFDAHARWWMQIVKFALGIAIVVGIRFGLKAILPETEVFDLLRYAVIGLWISLGAPWLFVTARLAKQEGKPIVPPTGDGEPQNLPI